MFAVVILGIGFILIAAIFPVAIQQTSATSEESNAASIARQAATSIAALPLSYPNPNYKATATTGTPTVQNFLWFPPTVKNYVMGTGTSLSPVTIPGNLTANHLAQTVIPVVVAPPAVVVPFVGARWDLLRANTILPNDPRYAFAAFYKRENNSSAAEAIVVSMIVRNRPTYDPTLDESYIPAIPISAQINVTAGDFATYTNAQPVYTTIVPDTLTTGASLSYEGAYLQIQNLTQAALFPLGRTYTLGRTVGNGAHELMPGDSIEATAGSNGLWGTTGAVVDQASNTPANFYPPSTFQATVAYARLVAVPTSPGGRIILTTNSLLSAGTNNPPPPSAGTGAFVIIADDCPTGQRAANGGVADYSIPPNLPGFFSVGALNGRIFRLGREVLEDTNMGSNGNPYPAGPGTYDLDPQYGMRPPGKGYGAPSFSPDTVPAPYPLAPQIPAKVYIIGVGRTNPADITSGYSGTSQDIGAFATYFQVQ